MNHVKKMMLALASALWLAAVPAAAAEGGVAWDKFPIERLTDKAALQNGAKLFANYCLNCHGAEYMRYNRLRDIGLTEEQITGNLIFTDAKVGELMKVNLDAQQAKEWFGAQPPDLSVIARSRSAAGKGTGADYIYTYLRTYYRDPSKASGWNNLAFPNVGMPHVLWQLQGQQRAVYAEETDAHHPDRKVEVFKGFQQISPGSMSKNEYNEAVADLVAFLQWMAEPVQRQREQLGVWVLLFLGVFTVIAWRLNAAFWKDVK